MSPNRDGVGGATILAADLAADTAVAHDWAEVERQRLAPGRAEAVRDVASGESLSPVTIWPALAGSLLAGVLAAILVNAVLRPAGWSPGSPDGSPAVSPLGLMATSPASARKPSDAGSGRRASESDRVEISDVETAADVFVPVPEAAIGPPPPPDRMPL